MARRTYTLEFKQSAARLVREQGYTIAQAAQSLGVDPGSIREWARKFAPPPAAATPADDAPAHELRREIARPRAENARLAMEREIL
jgi:transposase